MRETILEAYQRLEAEAVWRSGAEAQAKNVVVSIGAATLTISDMNDMPVTHWSLAALRRDNPGKVPAVYSPGGDAPETLETSDAEMIDALERVMRAVRTRGGHRGRVRWAIGAGVIAACIALSIFWLPGALAKYAAGIVPQATRADLGSRLAGHIEVLTGAGCAEPTGARALSKFERRLFPDGTHRLSIAPSALSGAAYLPGGRVVLSHTLVEDYETPAVAAAYALEHASDADAWDPIEHLLTSAGPTASMRLLSTGRIADDVLRRHAEELVGKPLQAVDIATVAPRVAEAGLSVDDLASALQGEAPPGLTVASPPALSDGEWIALQAICDG